MDAILTAGGIPKPGEPLYELTQGGPKALLEIAGKPMAQWVLDALSESKNVDTVVVVGVDQDSGLSCDKTLVFTPDRGAMLANIRAGVEKVLELNQNANHVLAVSSDIPAIRGEMVDWLANLVQESDHDIYYCVVTRQVMEARFPESKRSYIRLKDLELCGGDMNAIRARTVVAREDVWERILEARKSAPKQAAMLGYDTLLLLLLRKLDLESSVTRVSKRLNIAGRALLCPYAEVGMDIDKPHQLEILRRDLSQRVNG
ncbi:MAG: nucleotidyltransferase family protein [Anaerolineales bacterium]|nr:nucleotidyltransferase family protein [Anaerolineales bacterium]